MNGKTGKMLRRYARRTNKNNKDLKRWWESLPWKERRHHRQRILNELASPEA
jgi:hypothetical protein